MLLTDNKSVSKASYSAVEEICDGWSAYSVYH